MTRPALLTEILETLLPGQIVDLLIGCRWAAVVAAVDGERRCGLASIPAAQRRHGAAEVPGAGRLHELPVRELAEWVCGSHPHLASVGLATVNALLPRQPDRWVTLNAEEVIARRGAGKRVALVGHFPFIPRLRPRVGELSVLEQCPQPGDLPASAAPAILAEADVVALTSMTVHNHTLPHLLRLCPPDALVLLLGPSTPLSPLLFAHGVDILCGSIVTDVPAVMRVVGQGGSFRQIHRAGVRTVTVFRPGTNDERL